ncbi:MAG: C-terminal processing protease CtpA/Prc [Planctomycetota bacterium]
MISVRSNGGGSCTALRALLSYFLEDGARVVTNVAAYRLRDGESALDPEGYLENRGVSPAEASSWSAADRRVIAKIAEQFQPKWLLAKEQFRSWHYMLLSSDEHKRVDAYSCPVVLLIDNDCFSATDIFAGAFADWPQVTLVGEATGGGSGRSRPVTLPK